MNNRVFKSFIHHNRLWCYFVLSLFLLSSCSKNLTPDAPSGSRFELIVNVSGVSNPSSNLIKLGSLSGINDIERDGSFIVDKQMFSGSSPSGKIEIDMISSTQDIPVDNNLYPSSKNKISNIRKLASTGQEDMNEGVSYCFLIYKSTGEFVDVRIGKVGTPLQAWVNDEDDFVWYAYSYNSEDEIPLPDRNNPTITTSTTSPLLYATGTLTQANLATSKNLPIVFDQKLSKVEVELDTRSLFADMVEVAANFVDMPISTGVFNIKAGGFTSTTPVDVGNIELRQVDMRSSRLIENVANYYTASVLSSIRVKFTQFTIQHPNRPVLNLLPQLPNGGEAVFSGYTPGANGNGKLLKATLRPFLLLPSKKFLTIGTNAWGGNVKGFAANAGTLSGNFLRSPDNIGPTSKYIRMATPAFMDEFDYQLSETNSLESILSSYEPDVVIASLMYNTVREEDLESLGKFVLSGGVLFLLTETVDTKIQDMFRIMLNDGGMVLVEHSEFAGMYKVRDVDPDVTNGVFGDIRGKYWGQDGTGSQYLDGLSDESKLVIYTKGSVDYAPQNGITMARHVNRNFFFVGDTGFLAGEIGNTSWEYSPYQVDIPNGYFPVMKPNYGEAASISSALEYPKARGSWNASNSIIFGNALAWLIERAHFFGRNANGITVNEEFVQPKENNWNFRIDK